MREIKFRAKCLSDGRLVYGAYHKHLPYTPAAIRSEPILEKDYQHCIIQDGFSDWNMPRGFEGFEVDPKTVGQLTGLKDKNGVEIYEGDIVKNDHSIFHISGVVEYAESEAGFRVKTTDKPDYLKLAEDLPFKWSQVEVIGNIYENPELLEAK